MHENQSDARTWDRSHDLRHSLIKKHHATYSWLAGPGECSICFCLGGRRRAAPTMLENSGQTQSRDRSRDLGIPWAHRCRATCPRLAEHRGILPGCCARGRSGAGPVVFDNQGTTRDQDKSRDLGVSWTHQCRTTRPRLPGHREPLSSHCARSRSGAGPVVLDNQGNTRNRCRSRNLSVPCAHGRRATCHRLAKHRGSCQVVAQRVGVAWGRWCSITKVIHTTGAGHAISSVPEYTDIARPGPRLWDMGNPVEIIAEAVGPKRGRWQVKTEETPAPETGCTISGIP